MQQAKLTVSICVPVLSSTIIIPSRTSANLRPDALKRRALARSIQDTLVCAFRVSREKKYQEITTVLSTFCGTNDDLLVRV